GRPCDVIAAVDGHAAKGSGALAKQIGAGAPGGTAKLPVLRKGEEKTMSLTPGELPKERAAKAETPDNSSSGDTPKLGLMLAPAGQVAGSGAEGVVVTQVDPNGIASEQGFKTGDVILDVAGKKVTSVNDVRDAISAAHKDGKKSVLMRLKSADATRFVAVPLARG